MCAVDAHATAGQSRPKLSLDDLSGSLADVLRRGEKSDAAAAHITASVVLALQDAMAEDGAAPMGLVATLAAIAVRAHDQHEVPLIEACLCSLAQLTGEVSLEEGPPATVPDDVAWFALRIIRSRLSAVATGHAATLLMAAAQPLGGWTALLAAWRAEVRHVLLLYY